MKIKLIKTTGEAYEIEAASWEKDFLSPSKAVIVYNEVKSPISYITQVKEVLEIK